jgi:PKD repeat protein
VTFDAGPRAAATLAPSMSPRPRHPLPGLALAVALLLTVTATAHAARPRQVRAVDARVAASFVMHGRIVAAVRVRGERTGQAITRDWTFIGQACAGDVCRRLLLRRERSDQQYSSLVLRPVGPGRYAGNGSFSAGLECKGRLYPQGEVAPYRVTVTVTQAIAIQGIEFARSLDATYSNRNRADHTPCPIGPSHDAAVYTGVAAALPSPPNASLSVVLSPATDGAQFTDTSTPGTGAAPLVLRRWVFGDPASGGADVAGAAQVTHAFSAPGVYVVSLTVTDANGLSSTTRQAVIAPGPPQAAFTETRIGVSLAYAFADGTRPGFGGAPIVAWLWNFGDAASGSADESGAQDPQHTFTGPGTYHVCLIVRDGNGQNAGTCAQVTIPGGPVQSSKRSVTSTADNSAASRSGRLRTGEITAYRQNGRPA